MAIKFKQARGKGWRTLTIENGLALAPYYGWSDREYIVDLDYGPVGGAPAFLGQVTCYAFVCLTYYLYDLPLFSLHDGVYYYRAAVVPAPQAQPGSPRRLTARGLGWHWVLCSSPGVNSTPVSSPSQACPGSAAMVSNEWLYQHLHLPIMICNFF